MIRFMIFFQASKYGRNDIVRILLDRMNSQATIDTDSGGKTALHYAAENGDLSVSYVENQLLVSIYNLELDCKNTFETTTNIHIDANKTNSFSTTRLCSR